MDQKKIDRINEFARRVKAGEALTPAELAERDALRREYIDSVKASLVGQREDIYFCLLYTYPSPRDRHEYRMSASA